MQGQGFRVLVRLVFEGGWLKASARLGCFLKP